MAGIASMTAPSLTRVVVADDYALIREGLVAILCDQPDFQVIGEASDGAEAVARTREMHPDIVLMDIEMPSMDGLEATRLLTVGPHEWRIVILTVHADQAGLLAAIDAGASGYLLKTMHADDLVLALRGMREGRPPLEPSLAGHVVDELRRLLAHVRQVPSGPAASLTKREADILAMVARGASDKQIARALSISLYTVKAHMRNILSKLSASGRHEAARYARREGML